MLSSERPSKGALDEALHVNIAPKLVDFALSLHLIRIAIHQLGNDLLAADRARVVLLPDPSVEAH